VLLWNHLFFFANSAEKNYKFNLVMTGYSIVEYLGESSKEKCGYCKQTGGYNSHGFWAHSLSVEDYQGKN
jgi:hypothetical protein